MRVIINADDLGASEQVNEVTFRLMAEGRVTSATMLANGAAVREAARRTGDLPQCSFGVHLNLSQFEPLTAQPALRPILDDRGCFAGNALWKVPSTRILREAIFRELCAQVEHVRALGVEIGHFDGHHHVHTAPAVFPVLKRLQKEFGIRKVRITANIHPPHASPPVLRRALKALWNVALRHWYSTVTTDGFTSLRTFLNAARTRPLRYGSVEVMVHPGNGDFEDETRILWDDWSKEMPFEVTRISYREL